MWRFGPSPSPNFKHTGLLLKDETSETTVMNLSGSVSYICNFTWNYAYCSIKGSDLEKWKGVYRLTSKNIRWWSLLILIISVASIRRKLLKTNHTEERTNFRKLQYLTWIFVLYMNKRRLFGHQVSLALCFCMMVYLSTYANPLYTTSDLRQIRYNTTHPTY